MINNCREEGIIKISDLSDGCREGGMKLGPLGGPLHPLTFALAALVFLSFQKG